MNKWAARMIILSIILALSCWTIYSYINSDKFIVVLKWEPIIYDSSCELLPESLLDEVVYHVYVRTLNGFKVELIGVTKSTHFEIDLGKYQRCDIGVSATLLKRSSPISWVSDLKNRSESPCPHNEYPHKEKCIWL